MTVHAEIPGPFKLAEAQETALGTGGDWRMAMVPPEPEAGRELPAEPDATAPLMFTDTLELAVPAEIVKVAEAIGPFGIVVVLIPESTQVVDVLELEHDRPFATEGDVTVGSALTVTPLTSAGE